MKLLSKPLYIITLFILMLPGFCFGIGKQFVNCYIPLVITTLFLICLSNYKSLLNHIILLYKKTPFKYFVFFSVFSMFTIILSIFRGYFFFGGFITSTLGGLVCSILLPIIFVSFIFSKQLSLKFAIKFLYGFCWFVFLLGIIDFLVHLLDISFLKSLVTFLCNKRSILYQNTLNKAVSMGFPRAQSIFEEPSYLGYFILLVSPIVYEIKYNYKKIFKNKYINVIINKTIIPFMLLSLILTQSPIFLLFNIICTIFYYIKYRNFILFIRKYKYYILATIPFILTYGIFIYYNLDFDLENTFINRIILVLKNLRSFNNFVLEEPSLATRIIIFICGIKLFLSTHLIGVGYGNLSHIIGDIIVKSNLPLTIELLPLLYSDTTHLASTIFTKMTAETGIIGTIIFYYFTYVLYSNLNKLYKNCLGKAKYIFNGFKLFILLFICSSIYDSNLNQAWIWVVISIIFTIILKYKKTLIIDKKSKYKKELSVK